VRASVVVRVSVEQGVLERASVVVRVGVARPGIGDDPPPKKENSFISNFFEVIKLLLDGKAATAGSSLRVTTRLYDFRTAEFTRDLSLIGDASTLDALAGQLAAYVRAFAPLKCLVRDMNDDQLVLDLGGGAHRAHMPEVGGDADQHDGHAADGAQALRHRVGDAAQRADLLGQHERQRDRRVDVGARDAREDEDEDGDAPAEDERDLKLARRRDAAVLREDDAADRVEEELRARVAAVAVALAVAVATGSGSSCPQQSLGCSPSD
jgi:hypothetical protein